MSRVSRDSELREAEYFTIRRLYLTIEQKGSATL
jgi:hypothetical protein